ncbi:unnamed protein product [Larinioides sclopetarius]|uniref:Uncharacterized protein n=1 Tax=Larinioides sclopetarius TaxID=280406 RepID=A0AAV2ANA8_9ARAC
MRNIKCLSEVALEAFKTGTAITSSSRSSRMRVLHTAYDEKQPLFSLQIFTAR